MEAWLIITDQVSSSPGYTQEEKIEIAHRHLIPKQLEQHGLTPQQIQIPQLTTLAIITRLVILKTGFFFPHANNLLKVCALKKCLTVILDHEFL